MKENPTNKIVANTKIIQTPGELLGEHPKGLKFEFSADDLKNKIVSDMKSLSGDRFQEKQKKDDLTKQVLAISDISSHTEILKDAYQLQKNDFLTKIQNLEETYLIIKEWKSKNGKSLNPVEYFNPKTIFTLALLSGNELSKQVLQGTDGLNLTAKDIYVIKTFSLSRDFDILHDQGRLTSKEITLEKLNRVYDNSPDVMTTSDGEIYGQPSSLPVEKAETDDLNLDD